MFGWLFGGVAATALPRSEAAAVALPDNTVVRCVTHIGIGTGFPLSFSPMDYQLSIIMRQAMLPIIRRELGMEPAPLVSFDWKDFDKEFPDA